ncbi:MAG: GNAT family N-acetyltransferase [Kiloniellaceae bacterium]
MKVVGMSSGRTLRLAKAAECGSLSALALRSKAYWGYDPVFLQACREELTVSPKAIAAGRVVVLVEEDTPLGFYALDSSERSAEGEISLFFVEPAVIGHGIGRALWDHAVAKARHEGLTRLKVLSDPFALGFYRAVGATLSGKIRSPVRAPDGSERCLPVLHYEL